jgi:hypothetical protein
MIHLIEVWSSELEEYVTVAMDDEQEEIETTDDIQIVD